MKTTLPRKVTQTTTPSLTINVLSVNVSLTINVLSVDVSLTINVLSVDVSLRNKQSPVTATFVHSEGTATVYAGAARYCGDQR